MTDKQLEHLAHIIFVISQRGAEGFEAELVNMITEGMSVEQKEGD
jgi:hypothetical protein